MGEVATTKGINGWWILLIVGGLLALFYWKGKQVTEEEKKKEAELPKPQDVNLPRPAKDLTIPTGAPNVNVGIMSSMQIGGNCASLPPELRAACENAGGATNSTASTVTTKPNIGVIIGKMHIG